MQIMYNDEWDKNCGNILHRNHFQIISRLTLFSNCSQVGFIHLKKMETVIVILCFILMVLLNPVGKYNNIYILKCVIPKGVTKVIIWGAFLLVLKCNVV